MDEQELYISSLLNQGLSEKEIIKLVKEWNIKNPKIETSVDELPYVSSSVSGWKPTKSDNYYSNLPTPSLERKNWLEWKNEGGGFNVETGSIKDVLKAPLLDVPGLELDVSEVFPNVDQVLSYDNHISKEDFTKTKDEEIQMDVLREKYPYLHFTDTWSPADKIKVTDPTTGRSTNIDLDAPWSYFTGEVDTDKSYDNFINFAENAFGDFISNPKQREIWNATKTYTGGVIAPGEDGLYDINIIKDTYEKPGGVSYLPQDPIEENIYRKANTDETLGLVRNLSDLIVKT